MSRLTPLIYGRAVASLVAAISEGRTIAAEVQALDKALADYEKGGPEPDILAQAAANVLFKDQIGFPTDGTFTVTRGGIVDPVEYPLTFAGFSNAVNEAGTDGELGFKPGPNGAYETAAREALEQFQTLIASQRLGEPTSRYAN